MKKLASVLGVFVLVVGSFVLIARSASAQGSAPDWTVKDFWDYSGSIEFLSQTYTAIIHIEVVEKVKVTIGANTYETNHCTMTMSASFGSSSFSVSSDIYLRTSDLASVKMEATIISTMTTTTYEPPLETFKFPLSNGLTWTSTTTETTKTRGNTDTSTSTHNYTAAGPSSITVPAGTFSAYAITEHGQGGNDSVVDYSDSVGSMIRIGGEFMGTEMSSPFVLKSFNYQKPGFVMMLVGGTLLIAIIVAVIVALLVLRRRRRASMNPPMAPTGQPMYGQQPQQAGQPPYHPPPYQQPPPQP